LRQPLAEVVCVADVELAIGAFEDVQGEFHFLASLPVSPDCPSTSPLRGYAQGER
jgi:hypothetical protein